MMRSGKRDCARAYLDTACAPTLTWQLTRSRDNQDQPIRMSTLSGEPQDTEGPRGSGQPGALARRHR